MRKMLAYVAIALCLALVSLMPRQALAGPLAASRMLQVPDEPLVTPAASSSSKSYYARQSASRAAYKAYSTRQSYNRASYRAQTVRQNYNRTQRLQYTKRQEIKRYHLKRSAAIRRADDERMSRLRARYRSW